MLRVISDGFWAPTRAFSKPPPPPPPLISRKHMPLGIGTASLGMIGSKGDFMRYSYLYPYIFESRTLTLFESVLLAPTRAIWKGPPTIFRKHMPSGISTESLGMIGCIFAENGPLEGGIESSFSGTGLGAKGDFRWILGPNLCIFGGGPPTIFRKHMPRGIGKESVGMIECIFPENGFLESGIESSFSGTGWGAEGEFIRYSYLYPYIFESRTLPYSNAHALRYRHRKFGNDRIYIR